MGTLKDFENQIENLNKNRERLQGNLTQLEGEETLLRKRIENELLEGQAGDTHDLRENLTKQDGYKAALQTLDKQIDHVKGDQDNFLQEEELKRWVVVERKIFKQLIELQKTVGLANKKLSELKRSVDNEKPATSDAAVLCGRITASNQQIFVNLSQTWRMLNALNTNNPERVELNDFASAPGFELYS